MSNSQKHLVIVLGMHRSGSSAITCGLQALGIELGSHLTEPMPGVNDKGFFEDRDFYQLNEKILHALGTNWHALSPITAENLSGSKVENLEPQAMALLRNRLESTNILGLKDPRFPLLLPFWQQIFKELNLRVSYILSSRNPLSVAKSLAKRDNFQHEKAYYLWFSHMLLGLSYTAREALLVVDYDNVLESSANEIGRIAHFLGLQFDPNSLMLRDYQNDFLEHSLRHWRFSVDDLALDDAAPASMIELYKVLLDLAGDRLKIRDQEVISIIDRIKQSWLELIPALNYMQSLDLHVGRLILLGLEREEQIDQLKQELLEHEKKETKLKQELLEGDDQIRSLNRTVCESNAQILQLQHQHEVALSTIDKILSSRSWWVTKPLRFIAENTRQSDWRPLEDYLKTLRKSASNSLAFVDKFAKPAKVQTVEFMFIAEAGILEHQALLLAESIRLFTKNYSQSPMTVISPRADRRPSKRTLEQFEKMQINFVPLNIKSPCPEYGPTFRIFASAYFEKHSAADCLVVLDSDSIFVREPVFNLAESDALARPVDVKGICTNGSLDSNDLYWRKLCHCCGVNYETIPNVTTTVDKLIVKASYNGGFMVARRAAGIFQRTENYFLKSYECGLKPSENADNNTLQAGHGKVSPAGVQYWGSSQACISLAVWGSGLSVKTLPSTYNFPLHMLDRMEPSIPLDIKGGLVHLHYHHLFSTEIDTRNVFDGRIVLPEQVNYWLADKIPFTLENEEAAKFLTANYF